MAEEIPCVGWDLSTSRDKSTDNELEMASRLRQVFKKFVFQKEEGKDGYVHWQIRGHLYKKKRQHEAVAAFADITYKAAHWTRTSTEVHKGNNFNYVMKAEGRLAGPWTDKDSLADPPPLTRQLVDFYKHELYPWQKDCVGWTQHLDDRLIRCVVDDRFHGGNRGKSVFCEALEYEAAAYELPPLNDLKEFMEVCMGIPPQKCYLVDMPRAMKKEKLAAFYSGLESLKNGVMYDRRYAFKKRRIDRPQIIVFSNKVPDIMLLSLDRWDIRRINDQHELEPVNLEPQWSVPGLAGPVYV